MSSRRTCRAAPALAHLRAIRGIGQEELADILKVSGATVAQWELGERKPTDVHAAAIADFSRDRGPSGHRFGPPRIDPLDWLTDEELAEFLRARIIEREAEKRARALVAGGA